MHSCYQFDQFVHMLNVWEIRRAENLLLATQNLSNLNHMLCILGRMLKLPTDKAMFGTQLVYYSGGGCVTSTTRV